VRGLLSAAGMTDFTPPDGYVAYRRNLIMNPAWQEVRHWLDLQGQRWNPYLAHGGDEKITAEFARYPDAETFYRETYIYCYHGPAFFQETIKLPYYSVLFMLLSGRIDAAPILDFGGGTGDDALLFAQLGCTVGLADVPSKSLEFAKWRALKRGHALTFYTVGVDSIPRYPLCWCTDVLEHLPPDAQPGLLKSLTELGETVLVTLVSDPDADGRVHYPVDHEALTRHATTLSEYPVWFSDFHGGRVRLLVIGPGATLLPGVA
jgi:2-polyprenyl-3-methyl-5-hydroxy-6-metoxy-1,4-benzoquinol methylase